MGRISRDPADLVAQTIGPNHQYPDGFVLYLGTMFAPTQDRQVPGQGFTHEVGDRVETVSPWDPRWGSNANTVGGGTRVYGAQAWRFVPEDFRMASTYGVPEGSALAVRQLWFVPADEVTATAVQPYGASSWACASRRGPRRTTSPSSARWPRSSMAG